MSGLMDRGFRILWSENGSQEGKIMRGYFTAGGYYGLVDGKYVLFASESDYYEAMEEDED